jgi:hypothetical protein
MNRKSLKDRLAAFLKKYYSAAWISSGELQRIVAEKTDYTPQNVGRRLRELENEGVVEVKYVRGHAHYRFIATATVAQRIARSLTWFDELPVHQPSI